MHSRSMAASDTNSNGAPRQPGERAVSAAAYHGRLMATPDRNGRTAEWLRPRLEQQGLQRYVNTIRERIKLIVAVTLLTTAAAVVYVLVAHKEYTAESDM